MSTAQTIVNKALKLCNELSDLIEVDPDLQNEGFDQLVSLLNTMRGDGLYVTPQIPASINDEIKEFSWSTRGLQFELAEALAPFIQTREFSRIFYEQKKKACRTLYIKAKPPTDQKLPETMPVGSGNSYWYWWSRVFYGEHDNTKYEYYEEPNQGEAFLYVADFDADATKSGTTVSSVVWTIEAGTATISGTTATNNTSQSLITFNDIGTVKIKARATYANNEIRDFDFKFCVNGKEGSTW